MTRITTHPALKTCELCLVNFVFELGLQLGSMVLFHLAAQCFKEQWDLTVFVAIITTIHWCVPIKSVFAYYGRQGLTLLRVFFLLISSPKVTRHTTKIRKPSYLCALVLSGVPNMIPGLHHGCIMYYEYPYIIGILQISVTSHIIGK